jgi:putative permease
MSIKGVVYKWYERHLGNPEAVVLIFFLLFNVAILYFLGSILLPLLIALILAYLLEWPISWLRKCHIPRTLAVLMVFILFITGVILIVLGALPILKQQLVNLINNLPDMFAEGKKLLIALRNEYPNYVTHEQITDIVDYLKNTWAIVGKQVLSFSIASITNILMVIFYLFLVPLLAFFLLKDKEIFLKQANYFMPDESNLVRRVLHDVHIGLGRYTRGKFLEAFIVGMLTYILLLCFNLQYAALLSVLVGVSIFFPYIGAIIVTIPIMIVGLFQMGVSTEFIQLMIAYLILQLFDAYVLFAIIFAEAINMHPIIIILATILFGGLFGFWGVFFAIPLAILIQATIKLWPGYQ